MNRRKFPIPVGTLWLCSLLCSLLWPACDDPAAPVAPVRQSPAPLRASGDGAKVVTAAGTVVNRYAALGSDARRGDRTLALAKTDGLGLAALAPLVAGDTLLVVQEQGADVVTNRDIIVFGEVTDYGDAGRFELVTVKHVDDAAGTVEIYGNCGGLRNNYTATEHVQVVRVPQFDSLTVQAGGTIVAPPWNGAAGGVIAMLVRDGAQVDGVIDASARGFRGGQRNPITTVRSPGVGTFYASLSQLDGGAKGEGIAGSATEYAQLGSYGRGAVGNGGGGGNRLLGGGGGGGNGGLGTAWNGQGVMLKSVVGGTLAWPLDPGYDGARTTSAGGGRGGYTASSAALDPTTTAPGDASWMQDFRRERGGLGGRPVPNDPQNRLFLGGGGGSGDDFQSKSGRGGQGGGLIFLAAEQLSGSGRIAANGEDGAPGESTTGSGGGGGAGGTVILSARGLTGVTVEARGGRGGSQPTGGTQAAGPGGGGGGGFIALPAATQLTLHVEGGDGGTTASSDVGKFPRNGATDGAPGQTIGITSGEFGTSQICASADLSVQLEASPAKTQGLTPVTLQIAVQNRGPSPATDAQVTLQVPPGSTLQLTQPGDWDCTITGVALLCKRSLLGATATSTIELTLVPPLGADTIPISAKVTADTPDLDPSSNTTELPLGNATPVTEKILGGGLSCTLTPSHAAAAPAARSTLALALSALLVAFARRRARAKNS